MQRAQELGYHALALTDECSLAGVVRAHRTARELNFKFIVGSEFTLVDGLHLVLLAVDRESYGDLSELITQGRRAAAKGTYQLTRADIEHYARANLALWLPPVVEQVALADEQATWIAHTFPQRAWIAVTLVLNGQDRAHANHTQALSERSGLPRVAVGGVCMHVRARRPLHDVLTATRLGVSVRDAGMQLQSNSERHLRTREALARIYPAELLLESQRIAARCQFSLDELRYEFPEEIIPSGRAPTEYLRELTQQGMQLHWPQGAPSKVRDLVEHELALIAELKYEAYFLTVYDIVRFARSRKILCQGRGSAANSAVCYCLGITSVDPNRIETLFERFISKERNEPPDIDVDFEHERREEVFQYIYAKYGRERAALASTVITYRPRSAVRDVGKALGLSLEQIDRLAKNMQWWDDGAAAHERLREVGLDPAHPTIQHLLTLMQELLGFPRHLSQHVGGFVIARNKLSRLAPIENAAMPERTVIQWDKDDLDTLGLLKVDCLALGMLTAIHRAFDLVQGFRGQTLTLANIPEADPEVYAMIQRADTVGLFQIESRAQMAMLPRLKPACFYDLVIEVAIVRPGPIQGKMVHPYLRRRAGLEPVSYPSPDVRGVLERTLGVPIFQEQVIKLAMVAAGFSPGEADHLRRSMAAWKRKGGLEHFEQRLIDGMSARGYSVDFARQIFAQIQGFGEYGFPESHAASFALLAYVSAWLKCHEPEIFLCALLNSQPMGFYSAAQLVQDARRRAMEVRPVDVLHSTWDCSLESAEQPSGATRVAAVRLGLSQINGLGLTAAQRIVAARAEKVFVNVPDLAQRAQLAQRELAALATADALATLAGHRFQARWVTAGVESTLPLFSTPHNDEALPLLRKPSEGQDIVADYHSVGLTLRRHPLALLRARLAAQHILSAEQLRASPHDQSVLVAGLVVGRQRPGSAQGVTFVTLEDETGNINVIVWNTLAQRQRRILLQASLLGVAGTVQQQEGIVHLVARRLFDHSKLLGKLVITSRDFH